MTFFVIPIGISIAALMFAILFEGSGRTVVLVENDEVTSLPPIQGANDVAPSRPVGRSHRAREKAPAPPRIPSIVRVDVWKYEVVSVFGRPQRVKKLVVIARLQKGWVSLISPMGVMDAEEIDAEIEIDRVEDPVGFMQALVHAFPDQGLGAANGLKFAQAQYQEAA